MKIMLVTLTTALLMTLAPAAHAAEPVVYYHSSATHNWGMARVLADWSASPNVDVVKVASCEGHSPCIEITEQALDPMWGGQTYLPKPVGVVPWIVLNAVYANRSYLFRRTVLCHEVGHTLGVPHGVARGCMQASADGGQDTPSPWSLRTAHVLPGLVTEAH